MSEETTSELSIEMQTLESVRELVVQMTKLANELEQLKDEFVKFKKAGRF